MNFNIAILKLIQTQCEQSNFKKGEIYSEKLIITVIVSAVLLTALIPQLPVFAADYNYGEALQKQLCSMNFKCPESFPTTSVTTGAVIHVSETEAM